MRKIKIVGLGKVRYICDGLILCLGLEGNVNALDDILFSGFIYNTSCYTCNRDYDFYAYAGRMKHPSQPYSLKNEVTMDFPILFNNKVEIP